MENKSKPKNKTLKKYKPKPNIEFEIIEDNTNNINNIKKIDKKVKTKKSLKIPIEFNIMETRYNEQFIEIMEKLTNIMNKKGEPFRAKAYQKATNTIMNYPENIKDPEQLKGLPGIGPTIMEKLKEYVETGTLKILETEKTNPVNVLGEIYGIGPVKAEELVKAGITNIDTLVLKQDEVLNDIQKVGLKYHSQIIQRIPRSEIQEFETLFKSIFNTITHSENDKFEIVGSYRRGAETSGDIDVIITGNNGQVYKQFIDKLIQDNIILEVLSRGPSKTLVIASLLPITQHIARRIDFLFTPPDEFAFAILYFTGSKIFNTVMRQYALNKGYTFNEHGIYALENKKKGPKVNKLFKEEKDIFNFLGLQYKAPSERTDSLAVVPYIHVADNVADNVEEVVEIIPKKTKKNKKESTKQEQNDVDNNELLEIVNLFKEKGIEVLDVLTEQQLSDIILLSNNQYYNQEPIMTDNQYDIIKEYIDTKFPKNNVVHKIGAKVLKNKVKLPFVMASMDKIKPDTNALTNWTTKYKGPYVLSCKLDGVSGLYTTIGSEPKLYTRGDGFIGQDISYLIPHLQLPETKNIAIRGEFIIPKEVFMKKYKNDNANPRNMVAGLINHKTINEAIKDVHFVAYEVIQPELTPSKQMELLQTLNVEPVAYKIVKTLSNNLLSDLLIEWRQTNKYEIDGIIVTNDAIYPRTSGNPIHSFAFKMVLSDQVAEAKVVDVIWTPSKDGYLKPRVRIEPIHLGGVTIEYATGFNASFIQQNKIGIGSIIEIIRSGDVIPYIKSVTVEADNPKMPQVPYKWNDTHIDVMLENALEDETVKEKNITGFFRGIEVEGLSSGNINKLINAGYDSVSKIINMKVDNFLEVDGFKEKMANKLYQGIQTKLDEATIVKLMAASNIFGRGFSEKKMELIMDELPDILISDETIKQKVKAVSNIKGMATKTAEAFVSKINDFVNFLKECDLEHKLYEAVKNEEIKDVSHPLFGKIIVLTGTRDKNILDFIKTIGAKQGSSITGQTNLVIAKNPEDETGKIYDAKKLGIPILSVNDFITKYMK